MDIVRRKLILVTIGTYRIHFDILGVLGSKMIYLFTDVSQNFNFECLNMNLS